MRAPQMQTPGGGLASADTKTTNSVDFTDTAKTVATLRAQFARQGHEVYELADGGFLVSRWGMTRHLPDLRALAAFGRQIGALQ